MPVGDFKSFGGRDTATGRFNGSNPHWEGTRRTRAKTIVVHEPPTPEVILRPPEEMEFGVHLMKLNKPDDEAEREEILQRALANSKYGYKFANSLLELEEEFSEDGV